MEPFFIVFSKISRYITPSLKLFPYFSNLLIVCHVTIIYIIPFHSAVTDKYHLISIQQHPIETSIDKALIGNSLQFFRSLWLGELLFLLCHNKKTSYD